MTVRWAIIPFSLMLTCCGRLEFADAPDVGVVCDDWEAGEWSIDPSLRFGDYAPMFYDDPELEAYLLTYGMDRGGGWDRYAGTDFYYSQSTLGGEEWNAPIAVSPYAKALSAFEAIATSFNGWETFVPGHALTDFEYYDNALKWFAGYVHQNTAPVYMDCGDAGFTAVAQRISNKGWRITYFGDYFLLKHFMRASISVHEVVHVEGPGHDCGNYDCDWGWNAYSVQAMWLVAYANEYEDGTSIQNQALKSADAMIKHIENGTTWTARSLLETLRLHGVEHYITKVPHYQPSLAD